MYMKKYILEASAVCVVSKSDWDAISSSLIADHLQGNKICNLSPLL